MSDGGCVECPACFGTGQITGPRSLAYRYDPADPFNAELRCCDECDGTGVITALAAAAIAARAEQHAYAAIEKACPELHAAAVEQAERQMRDRGLGP